MRSLSKKVIPRLLTQQNVYKLYLHEYQAYELLKKYQVPLVQVQQGYFRAIAPAHPRTPGPSQIG
jgi:hypothetical protein